MRYSADTEHRMINRYIPKFIQRLCQDFCSCHCLNGSIVLCDQTRVVKNDFTRYNLTVDDVEEEEEGKGWKIIHGDVFRFPPYSSLFSAILGQRIPLLFQSVILNLQTSGVPLKSQLQGTSLFTSTALGQRGEVTIGQ